MFAFRVTKRRRRRTPKKKRREKQRGETILTDVNKTPRRAEFTVRALEQDVGIVCVCCVCVCVYI